MRTYSFVFVATVFLVIALSSCSTAKPVPLPERIELPVKAEPAFASVKYESLSDETKMLVKLDSSDLKSYLKARFSALTAQRASLVLLEEQLVKANGSYYRRIWFSYGDEATNTMHGPCNQNIYLWLSPSGEIAETYVDQMSCPI